MTKGRNPGPTPTTVADTTDMDAVSQKSAALTVLASRSHEAAERFDDGQPYVRSRVVSEARFFMASSAEAMFELGKRLILIKENEPRGEFMELVTERLGIPYRTAFRFMAASLKLTTVADANLPALASLGKTKLFELLDEPSDDIQSLAEGGTVAGLNLDDMQAMSSRELRAALVESRKTAAAKDAVIAKKDQKLNDLTEAEERRRSASRNEAEAQHLADLRDATLAVETALELLLSKLDDVMTSPPTEACSMAARQALDYVAQRLVDSTLARGMALNLEERVIPLHMQAIRDAVQAAHGGKAAKANGPVIDPDWKFPASKV